jgi:hypothetical protein
MKVNGSGSGVGRSSSSRLQCRSKCSKSRSSGSRDDGRSDSRAGSIDAKEDLPCRSRLVMDRGNGSDRGKI